VPIATARLEGTGLYLRPHEPGDAPALLDVVVRNRDFLSGFEPPRPEGHYTLEGQKLLVQVDRERWDAGVRYAFGIFLPSGRVAGRVALDNVVMGAWHNATLGYYVDRELNGRGLCTRAVALVAQFAFEHAGLHRIQAAVMPHNAASVRVLEKVGFRHEGLAKRYLFIDGAWEDHDIYALTVEDWSYRGSRTGPLRSSRRHIGPMSVRA
jgi:[ribosomal protein S5]-alanine N-acetyltransferase